MSFHFFNNCGAGQGLVRVGEGAFPLEFQHISATLVRFGFTQCEKDQCVFNLVDSGVHRLHLRGRPVHRRLSERMNAKIGDELEYLDMELLFIDRMRGRLTIKQTGYIKELMSQYGVQHTAGTPCTLDLMEPPSESESDSVPVFDYTSKLMKLMYLPDILFTMSFLATKCKDSCVSDNLKLDRVLRDINSTYRPHSSA
jgi:hypothetical protein